MKGKFLLLSLFLSIFILGAFAAAAPKFNCTTVTGPKDLGSEIMVALGMSSIVKFDADCDNYPATSPSCIPAKGCITKPSGGEIISYTITYGDYCSYYSSKGSAACGANSDICIWYPKKVDPPVGECAQVQGSTEDCNNAIASCGTNNLTCKVNSCNSKTGKCKWQYPVVFPPYCKPNTNKVSTDYITSTDITLLGFDKVKAAGGEPIYDDICKSIWTCETVDDCPTSERLGWNSLNNPITKNSIIGLHNAACQSGRCVYGAITYGDIAPAYTECIPTFSGQTIMAKQSVNVKSEFDPILNATTKSSAFGAFNLINECDEYGDFIDNTYITGTVCGVQSYADNPETPEGSGNYSHNITDYWDQYYVMNQSAPINCADMIGGSDPILNNLYCGAPSDFLFTLTGNLINQDVIYLCSPNRLYSIDNWDIYPEVLTVNLANCLDMIHFTFNGYNNQSYRSSSCTKYSFFCECPSDNESCTTDACVGWECKHTFKADGTSCNKYAIGKCFKGVCTNADCDDKQLCTTDSFDMTTGQCKHVALPDNTVCASAGTFCKAGFCTDAPLTFKVTLKDKKTGLIVKSTGTTGIVLDCGYPGATDDITPKFNPTYAAGKQETFNITVPNTCYNNPSTVPYKLKITASSYGYDKNILEIISYGNLKSSYDIIMNPIPVPKSCNPLYNAVNKCATVADCPQEQPTYMAPYCIDAENDGQKNCIYYPTGCLPVTGTGQSKCAPKIYPKLTLIECLKYSVKGKTVAYFSDPDCYVYDISSEKCVPSNCKEFEAATRLKCSSGAGTCDDLGDYSCNQLADYVKGTCLIGNCDVLGKLFKMPCADAGTCVQPECVENSDCLSPQKCINQTCFDPIEKCLPGEDCSNYCVPTQGADCESDSDCSDQDGGLCLLTTVNNIEKKVCNYYAEGCINLLLQCKTDADCPAGYTCITNKCIPDEFIPAGGQNQGATIAETNLMLLPLLALFVILAIAINAKKRKNE